MSDARSVFTILEDNSTADGVKLPARQVGDAIGGNHVPSIIAKNSAGVYKLIEERIAGEAASSVNALPALPATDLSGNYQYLNLRAAGDAISGVGAIPVLIGKDSSGNFQYIRLNSDGEVVISNDPDGTKKFGYAKVAPSAINTLTTVVDLTLTASKTYEYPKIRVSCARDVMWELVQVNDVTLTVLDSMITGAGAFTFSMNYDHMFFSTGATGVQKLRIRATQLSGTVSDLHGYVSAFEKA